MEDRGGRFLSVQLLQRLVETQHHEDNRDAQAKVSRLIVAHFDSIKVECTHRVGRKEAI